MWFANTRFRQMRPLAFRAVVTGTVSLGFYVALTTHYPAFAAGAYTVTIPRGGTTAVELAAPANARCVLGPMNSPSSQRLTAISDARGIVRYFVSVNRTARTGVLATLECTGSKAHTLVGLVLMPGAPAPRAAPVSTSRPVTMANLATTARFGVLPGTPPGFDVTTASAAQLAQLHYPPRPDPHRNPMIYAIWRKAMTTPGAYVPTVPVPIPSGPKRVLSPAQLSATRASGGRLQPEAVTSFQNWSSSLCGSIVVQLNSPFLAITGQWSEPFVTSVVPGMSTSSTTIALNGVSMGTEQDAVSIPGAGFAFSSYYAWYQVDSTNWSQPPARYGFPNISIGPGESLYADMIEYPGDAFLPGLYGMTDLTTGTTSYMSMVSPVYPGYAAEWGEETESQLPLAQFTPVTINGSADSDPSGSSVGVEYQPDGNAYYDYAGGPAPFDSFQTSYQMTSTGSSSGDPMCNSSLVGPSGNVGVGLQFVAPY